MAEPNARINLFERVIYFPLTRMIVGFLVCGFALLATNSVLRLLFQSEGDISRIIRWLLSTLALLATYYFLFKSYEKREITELSITGSVRESLGGLALGTICISLIIAVLYTLGYYEVLSTDNASALLMPFFYLTTLGVFEELVFRGILYRIIELSLGTNLALVISGLLFGLAHIPNPNTNLISVISAASGGILAGLLFSMTSRLWMPIFFHAGWNWALVSYGVAVSGIDDLPGFIQARLQGPELITGGAFGPENSILTIGLVLALSILAYYRTLKRGNIVRRPTKEPSVE